MLVTINDFVGQISVAQVDSLPVRENLELFIKQREPEILTDILGSELYDYVLTANENIKSGLLPLISVAQSGDIHSLNKFYVSSYQDLVKIKQAYKAIYINPDTLPLTASIIPYPDGSEPLLSDIVSNSYIKSGSLGSDGVLNSFRMVFDAIDENGSLGRVFIDELFSVEIDSPELWGVIDTSLSLTELLTISGAKNAKLKSYGFQSKTSQSVESISVMKIGENEFRFFSVDFFVGLIERLKKIASNYIWYYFSRDQDSLNTSSGQARPVSENAVLANPAYKQAIVWNEMVDLIYKNDSYSVIAYSSEIHGCEMMFKYSKINHLNF